MSESYLGNLNLKRSNVKLSYTFDQIKEWHKCSKDPVYFIETYVKIVNVDLGLINFHLYDYQEKIVNLAVNDRFVICKMPRQCGKTTTIVGVMLWYVLFHETFSIAILANKLAQAREILGRIQLAYEHLPKWMQQGIVEWNKGNIELENGSKILASATSSSAIRGTSQNLIYLDEFAFVPNNMQEDFFSSVYPTISSGKTTKVLITSTPNGLNAFYKLWVDSEEGRNEYKRVDVHWSDVPGRDEEWKEQTIRNTSEDQFRVEFECEFVGSSSTLISSSKLRKLTYNKAEFETSDFKVYSQPTTDRLYTIIVDTARGIGGDYSAFVVVDITEIPYKVAAVYRNNLISPLLYPHIIYDTATKYNNAFVLPETNDIGQQVADILHQELEYENIFFASNNGRSGQIISAGFGGVHHSGVRTTKTVKRIGCSTLKTLIESDKLIINDYQILYELTRFSLHNNSYEAEEGNDDLVMCLVLFGWLVTQPYFKELSNMDIRKNLYIDNEIMLEEEMLPFGIIADGHDEATEPVVTLETDIPDAWLR